MAILFHDAAEEQIITPTDGAVALFTDAGLLKIRDDQGAITTFGSMIPYSVSLGTTFTVPFGQQLLYSIPLNVQGDVVIDGYLVEVG